MKKLLFLLSLCLCATATWAFDFSLSAPSGQTLYYTITSSSSPLTVQVSYPGSSPSDPWSGFTMPTGSLSIPDEVSFEGDNYSVTSIGQNAFDGCTGLTSVTIPNTVTYIGNYAFRGCTSLTSVTIPNSVTSTGSHVFEGCTSLSSITIPNSMTSIANYTFAACSNLTSVTIPNSVTSIGMAAFNVCTSLSNIIIPNSVSEIGVGAFRSCTNLTAVTIPNSVTTIGQYAFDGCSNLKTVYNLSALTIETTSYNLSANRVVVPTKFGTGNNAIYKIPTTYSFADAETNVETEIPRSSIPTNFIYNDNGWKANEIILTDGQDEFSAPETFIAASASYTRDFTNTNRSTLYLPFSASIPEDLEVYDFSSFANNTLSFTEHSGNLAAYTPYLVGYDISTKDGNTTTCTVSATNVTFPKSETTNYHPVTSNGMTFQGVIERTTMSSTSNYGYSNGYFVQSGGSAHVNPFRCYFSYTNPPASVPPMLNVDIIDGEVGIEEAETIDTPNVHFYSTDVYDMMGRIIRRNAENLNGLPRGIYIWKGKKVVHINY